MDSLTQAVLGASVQGVGLGKYQGRKALFYGALLGTLPDLDVLIHYADPISRMTYHRGFSHSLLVLPVFALILAWLIKKIGKNNAYSFSRLYATLCLALITHPLLDAFTVYGTQLFWPFTPIPQQWSGVFIIDPLYTLPLLFAVLWMLIKGATQQTQRILALSLLWSCLYLAWGTYGQYHHQQRVQAALASQGIVVQRIMATPMPLNTLLFRVVAETDNDEYIDAVSGWFDTEPPEFIRLPQGLHWKNHLQNNFLFQRLNWFTDGWLAIDNINKQLVVTDLRMGVPGNHNFRFIVAEQDVNGQWHNIEPQRSRQAINGNTTGLLAKMWHRIWHSLPPLPLAQWQQNADTAKSDKPQ
ncbi:metal-dependent hydrolase [Stenoxybacter acetivorans]|uniref:metal-dependent hydrolase n=1 Tax=Stenoxybacter acetivorans TaxID=422441 RepID=UPI0005660E15|nr:metal-dependent hydrolase [Stenoxybacter acetivorans]